MNKKAAVKAVSLLWIGAVAGSGCALITQILLARYLNPSGFGGFTAALATVNIVAPLAAFGVPAFWLKAFGEEGARAQRWLVPSYKFVGASGFVIFCAICIWAVIGPNDRLTTILLLILAPATLCQMIVSLLSSKLQLEGRYISLAGWQLSINFLRFISVAFIAMMAPRYLQPLAVSVVYCGIAIVIFVFAIKEFANKQADKILSEKVIDVSIARPSQLDVARQSWQFGISGLAYLVYYQIDIVLLKYMAGEAAAGTYGAAYLIVGATYLLPDALFQKYLLPKLHRWAYHDITRLNFVLMKGTAAMFLLGIVAAAVLHFIGPYIVHQFFGQGYEKALVYLSILVLCIPIKFASSSAGAVLTSGPLLNKKIYIMVFAAMVNVIANVVFIPAYDGIGSAWVTVATESIIFLGLFSVAYRRYG